MFAGLPIAPVQYLGRPPQVIHRDRHFAIPQQRLPTQPLLAPKPSQGVAIHPHDLQPHAQVYHGGGRAVAPEPSDLNATGPGLTYLHGPVGVPVLVPDPARAYSQDQWIDPRTGDIHMQAGSHSQPVEPASHTRFRPGYEADPTDYKELQEWDFEDYREGESDDETSGAGSMVQLRGPKAGLFVSHMFKNPHDPHGTLPRYFMPTHSSMATYDPEPSHSPLNDEHVRAVFSHFIRVTGPAISLYERHSFEPGTVVGGQQLPRSQRHIWSCTSRRSLQIEI